jgi:hypothetical protein
MHAKVVNDDGNPTLNKRMYGIKGYHAVLVDEERKAYEMRATYKDTRPLDESFECDSGAEGADPCQYQHSEEDMFTSKNHRVKLKFQRHP